MADSFMTKYRSRNFDEYIGNEALVSTVLNRFATDSPYPATVMTFGGSGTGKTTIARLIAKQVSCPNKVEKVINSRGYHLACNECSTCLEMDNYIATGDDSRLSNVLELDATQSRSADAIDDFITSASVPNIYGDYNIYIMDECHKFSKTAQNSLLKFTEDAPERSIFIFCTTDPQLVIEALKTRMQVMLEVLKPSLENNIDLLTMVCEREDISFDRSALALIAERSNYVYRTSLSNLENVYRSYGIASYDNTAKVLDVAPTEVYFKFFRYLLDNNLVMYTQLIHQVDLDLGVGHFITELTKFVTRGIYINVGVSVEGVTRDELKKFKELFQRFSLDEMTSILSFLDTVRDGDIQTRLLLLGYRGLTHKEEPKSDTIIELSDKDVSQEHKAVVNQRKVDKSLAYDKAIQHAEVELKPLTKDSLLGAFFGE